MPSINVTPSTDSEKEANARATRARAWHKELESAYKREKSWRKDALTYTQLYEAGKRTENQYNILYANTEVLGPAVYNSVPRPVVDRRFKDEDPLGKMASKAAQRMLEYMVNDGHPSESTFDELMKSAVLEAFVPGRGVTRFRYEAEFEKVETLPDGDVEAETPERVKYEYVCGEEVPWDRFRHGYAKKWKDVPWVAFEHDFSQEELKESFPDTYKEVPEPSESSSEDDSDTSEPDGSAAERADAKLVKVFEIWDKVTRKVYFVTPSNMGLLLKEVDDPFQLDGFFPCPRPLTFIQKISSLVPVPPYSLYEEQSKELNRVTVRINKLLAMLKVRGMYDASIEGIDKVLSGDDGELVPAANVASMAQGQTLEKALWLVPIDKIIATVQQLYQARPQIKAVIFEISGIADIMRGSSAASETLGAQKIKESWGTLRLKRAQKEAARYARDCLRIMAELGVSKLSPQTIQAMTGLPYPMQSVKQQAQMQLQQAIQMGAAQQPQAQQQLAQLAQAAQTPSWEDLLTLLRDDVQRSFRIDIETNSTVDAEATEDKQDISEILNAISQFLSGVGPLIESGMMPFEVAKGMLVSIVRRFRFGNDIEDQLKQMQAPQPKPDPSVAKAQADLQASAQEHQFTMQEKQLELQMREHEMQLKAQSDSRAQQLEERRMQMEMEFMLQEHQLKLAELSRKAEAGAAQHQQKLQQMSAQVAAAKAMPKPAVKSAGSKPA